MIEQYPLSKRLRAKLERGGVVTDVEKNTLSYLYQLSDELIIKYHDSFNWDLLVCNKLLSEAIIAQFQDEVNWTYVSRYQTLSMAFINFYQDKVNWDEIIIHQDLSEDFLLQHLTKLPLKTLKLYHPNFYAKYELWLYQHLTKSEES